MRVVAYSIQYIMFLQACALCCLVCPANAASVMLQHVSIQALRACGAGVQCLEIGKQLWNAVLGRYWQANMECCAGPLLASKYEMLCWADPIMYPLCGTVPAFLEGHVRGARFSQRACHVPAATMYHCIYINTLDDDTSGTTELTSWSAGLHLSRTACAVAFPACHNMAWVWGV